MSLMHGILSCSDRDRETRARWRIRPAKRLRPRHPRESRASLRATPRAGGIPLRERFDAGTGLVAIGAVLLLVSLFIDWYKPGGDAWAVFESLDLVLAAAAICGLLAVAPRFGTRGPRCALPSRTAGPLGGVVH